MRGEIIDVQKSMGEMDRQIGTMRNGLICAVLAAATALSFVVSEIFVSSNESSV
ncbi:hypothetical protein IQ238_03340 [Pleurocapsales cyanobacterium LEGE 06147]|nr:hypothetical protein [Pleurocapsales cyanobacterium LEGE 06147]